METKSKPEIVAQRFYLQALARNILPEHRISCCLRRVVPNKQSVEIWRSPSRSEAHYRNLVCCASLWVCPVCAAKISERRRVEITRVLAAAKGVGLQPVLATYTMQHGKHEPLQQTLTDITSAYAAMTSGGGWIVIKDKHHLVGYIRTFEMTHGANGWHPHIHTLVLADADTDKLAQDLSDRWLRVLETIGRTGLQGIACDVRVSNDAIADYIAKWGHQPIEPERTKERYWSMAHEVAKATSKKAGASNRNPFEILADTAVTSDSDSRSLFREYVGTTKGKRQLEWSRQPNLHKLAGISEMTDEQAVRIHEEDSYILAKLTIRQWHVVLRNAAVGTLLKLAGDGNITELTEFLEDIGAGNAFDGIDVT